MSENNNVVEQNEELDMNHLIQIRREKLKDLQEAGKNPFEVTKQFIQIRGYPNPIRAILEISKVML